MGSTEILSFDDFMSKVYREPWEDGVYIYNGDTPAHSLEELKEVHRQLTTAQQGLAVNRVSWGDDVWSGSQKLNLRYCVSNGFGGNKARVVSAMAAAAAAWERHAVVDFIYDSAQDANCTNANSAVTFDVNLVNTSGKYLARAFFPSSPRSSRNVYIDVTAFSSSLPLQSILMHELGHTLGFRHEHTRPEAGQCFEDNVWRGVTPYDRASVMHYPDCGGTNSTLSSLSTSDIEGATFLYGSRTLSPATFPGGCGIIRSGYGLRPGQGISSCDGRFWFTLQTDGNLVLYKNGAVPIWNTYTDGQPAYGVYMQGDGNFVLYTGLTRPLWHTYTDGHHGAYFHVQNDGNLVVYNTAGFPVWNSGTFGH
ncbi:MAG TPA: M57 family metalloprotease [Myxococcus sp.]|nr:M57 family metalloprotease [Myxococcus sp.]